MSRFAADVLREKALRLLAQREHSRAEMVRKLADRTEDQEEIPALLDHLEQVGLLSDARFAASYVRSHAGRFGVMRLRHDLSQRGVAEEVAEAALASELDPEEGSCGAEMDRARAVWQKKFKEAPTDAREYARQARFLQGRGFPADTLHKLLKHPSD
ncbi:MAG: recombination regulator RecX [Rhodocyclaceae bacterium]|nr:recombination regulator RecX [Rhodocyclaceae bacterium]